MCEHESVPGEATILHADLDAFYASVEQRDDPRLRGRPVIVGAGVVLAASYEAKARGVRTAMGGRQARRLCPQAVVVSPRMSAYSEASKAVFEVFRHTTPLVEGLSIDEAFLDVGGLRRVSGTPTEIAVRLRREVRERVGLPITVGVARTKFLAKVASTSARRPWSRSSARRSADTCTRWRTTATPGRCRSGAAGARWARSGRSVARRGLRTRSTPRSPGWSTGSPAGCGPPGGPVAPWCSGCGSTTSAGPPVRTPCPAPPRTARRSCTRPGRCCTPPAR